MPIIPPTIEGMKAEDPTFAERYGRAMEELKQSPMSIILRGDFTPEHQRYHGNRKQRRAVASEVRKERP